MKKQFIVQMAIFFSIG